MKSENVANSLNQNKGGWQKRLIETLSVLLCLFVFGTTLFGHFPNIQHRAIILFVCFLMGFLIYPSGKKKNRLTVWFDWLLIAGTFVSCLHVYLTYWDFMLDPATPEPLDLVMGCILVFCILELSRRCLGWVFTILILVFCAYALLGHLIPGTLGHGGTRWQMLLDMLYLSTDGIWGSLMAIFVGLLVLFVIFSSLIMSTGGGQTFLEIAKLIGGRMRGGPAKIAVVSSALVGSITGSSVTNVALTGNFTIPMMKRLGYRAEVAGGIEATASSGGQITPPLMGAGLFLMAELLDLDVSRIMLYALVPASLFYVAVLSSVHFDSCVEDIQAIPEDEIPHLKDMIKFSVWGPVVLPFITLVLGIIYGYSVDLAILMSIGVLLISYLVGVRSLNELKEKVITVFRALAASARPLVSLCALICAAGLLVGVIGYVGIGVKFSELVLTLGGGYMWPTLILSAIVVLIIGMGIPTTAAYVLAASVIAVTFQKMGIGELQAHMFIFYFATLSAITPPVCAAVFVAAGLAEASWLKVAWHTVRFAMIKYIMPFLFIFNPAILMQGEPLDVGITWITCALGAVYMSSAFSGFLFAHLAYWERGLACIASVLLFYPSRFSNLAGLVLIIILSIWNWKKLKNQKSDLN